MNQNVFEYEVSGQKRFGDPFKIDRLITANLGGDRKGAIERTRSPDPATAALGMDMLLTAISKAFGIPRLDETTGEGALEDTLFSVFGSFLDWKVEQKKNAASSPTSPASSDSPASSAPMSPTTLHTQSSMASG